jgi:hypothetical protein
MKKKKKLALDIQQNLCAGMLKGAKVKKLRNLRKSYDQKTVQNNLILFLFRFIHFFSTQYIQIKYCLFHSGMVNKIIIR